MAAVSLSADQMEFIPVGAYLDVDDATRAIFDRYFGVDAARIETHSR